MNKVDLLDFSEHEVLIIVKNFVLFFALLM